MAVLFISEFANLAATSGRDTNVFPMPPVAEQTVAIGASSAQSSAFSAVTNFIRVCADAVCSIEIGASSLNSGTGPAATATKMRIPANVPEYFAVRPGQILAVIQNT